MQFNDRNLTVSMESDLIGKAYTLIIDSTESISSNGVTSHFNESYQFKFTENEWNYLLKQLTTWSN